MGSPAQAVGPSLCARFLSQQEVAETADLTDRFVAYLAALWEDKVFTLDDLGKFTKVLEEKNKVPHPFSESVKYQSDRSMHAEALQEYLNYPEKLNQNKILLWAKNHLTKNQIIRHEKSESSKQTEKPFSKMKFLKADLSLLRFPIEIMRSVVTQQMWVEVMGKNPSSSNNGGDYPVENMTLWSAMTFANKISEKNGLKPYYDLEGFTSWQGNAEDGSLMLLDNNEIEVLVNRNIEKSSRMAEEEGYRLPTVIEYTSFYEHYYRKLNVPIESVAWVQDNSKGQSHEVNEDPQNKFISENDFLGVVGNVNIWTNDLYSWAHDGGRTVDVKVVAGSFETYSGSFSLGLTFIIRKPNDRHKIDGLRLVRTLK